MNWAFSLLEVFILGAMKLSVIFFYRRLFLGRAFDVYSKGMIAIVGTWNTAFFFTPLFQCGTKFHYLWSNRLDFSIHCTDGMMYGNAYAISDVITDFLILATPVPIVCT